MKSEMDQKKSSSCNCLNMRRASQAITEIYNDFIAPSGLNIGQFALLKHINRLQPVNVSELAQVIRLDRTTLVRNLKPLEGKGFVLDAAEKQSRNRQLTLTEAGAKILEEAELLWEEAQNYIEQFLGKDELALLTGLLSKVEGLKP